MISFPRKLIWIQDMEASGHKEHSAMQICSPEWALVHLPGAMETTANGGGGVAAIGKTRAPGFWSDFPVLNRVHSLRAKVNNRTEDHTQKANCPALPTRSCLASSPQRQLSSQTH